MEIRQLEAFLAVASQGSFKAASNKLGMTQPAISARIGLLEEQLRTPLFDRGSRPVRLTSQGYRLLAYAESIVDLAGQMTMSATQKTREPARRVRIGIPSALVRRWTPVLIKALQKDWPELQVELHIDRSAFLREQLRNAEIDAALLIGPITDPGMRCLRLKAYSYDWICSPLLTAPRRFTLSDIAEFPVITYAKGSSAYVELGNMLKARGNFPQQLSGSNSSDAILSVVKEGLAIGYIMRVAAEPDIAAGVVYTLELAEKIGLAPVEYYAAYKHDGTRSVGMLVAELASAISEDMAD